MSGVIPFRQRALALMLIMGAVAAAVATTALFVVYQAAMEQQRQGLAEIVRNRASLIRAVARFDRAYSAEDVPGGSLDATLSQIRDAHRSRRGFGLTGEFTLARRESDAIVFLLSLRHATNATPNAVAMADAERAQPMRAALQGLSGTMVGRDYRGSLVLAAYEPLPELDAGIVAKIDLAEIRRPYRKALRWSVVIGLGLILLGGLLFRRVGAPLMQQLEENDYSVRMWQNAFAFTDDGIMITDARRDGHPVVSVNPAFERITGYQADEVVGRSCRFLRQDDAAQTSESRALGQAMQAGRNCQVLLRHYRKDGRPFWNQLSISPVKDSGQKVTHFLSILRDVTGRKQMEDELKRLATHDALTDLFNRGEIERVAALEIGRSKRYKHQAAILMIDIDHFKHINDTWGHPTGDLVLQRFAHVLRATIRADDLAGRYGGEEFLVVMPETGPEQALHMAERLRHKISSASLSTGVADRVDLSVSIGVAVYPRDGATRDHLIGRADQALYAAKQAGRDRVASAHGPEAGPNGADEH